MIAAGTPGAYSLGRRLSWFFAALTVGGFGALSLAIYAAASWSLDAKADAELARKTDLVKRLVAEAAGNGDVPAMRHKLDEFFLAHEDLHVVLFDIRGVVRYEGPGRVNAAVLRRRFEFPLPPSLATTDLSMAHITMDRSDDAALLAGLAAVLATATLLGTLVVSISGFWLVRRSMAPLRGLAERTRALRADRLDQRLTLEPPVEELQPWIDQFNALLDRLGYAYGQLEGFNADVAHELRTPLATLIGQTEVELSRDRSAAELRATLESNLEEVRRLASIVNDMLFLARADRGAQVADEPLASLREQVRQALDFQEGPMAEREVTARIAGDALASFDAGLVRRAVSNLVGNAARYATHGSEVVVALREEGSLAWIEVCNQGEELPSTALPRLFDRFFRLQPAREGSAANHGLGLAIVAAIARMHGGTTRASSVGGRTTIGFSISGSPRP